MTRERPSDFDRLAERFHKPRSSSPKTHGSTQAELPPEVVAGAPEVHGAGVRIRAVQVQAPARPSLGPDCLLPSEYERLESLQDDRREHARQCSFCAMALREIAEPPISFDELGAEASAVQAALMAATASEVIAPQAVRERRRRQPRVLEFVAAFASLVAPAARMVAPAAFVLLCTAVGVTLLREKSPVSPKTVAPVPGEQPIALIGVPDEPRYQVLVKNLDKPSLRGSAYFGLARKLREDGRFTEALFLVGRAKEWQVPGQKEWADSESMEQDLAGRILAQDK